MEKNKCVVCSQVISNPICKECYIKEVEVWFRDKHLPYFHKRKIIESVNEMLFNEEHSDDLCILCDCNEVLICSYCFFFRVAKILKSHGISRAEIDQFLTIFNYRHYHEEYFFLIGGREII